MKPYDEVLLENNTKVRLFRYDVLDSELIWHVDKHDRVCFVLYGKDWQYQLDNSLPITVNSGDEFIIPKGKFHRLIKGTTNFAVIIKEIAHEHSNESYKCFNETHDKTNPNIHTIY